MPDSRHRSRSLCQALAVIATMYGGSSPIDRISRVASKPPSFGTGYSSLAYLSRFPIDTLKIDRSFVGSLEEQPRNASITEAIIAMATSLHMAVVAEGVETEAQLRFLRRRVCETVQGFYFSRPLPPTELLAWATERVDEPAA